MRNLLVATAVALSALSGSGTSADAPPRKVTCSFSHPAYSGYCKETQDVPGGSSPAGVCQEILACLNTTSCSKTYCNATTQREGWKLEKVEPSN